MTEPLSPARKWSKLAKAGHSPRKWAPVPFDPLAGIAELISRDTGAGSRGRSVVMVVAQHNNHAAYELTSR